MAADDESEVLMMLKWWFVLAALLLMIGGVSAQDDISPTLEDQLITLETITQRLRGLDALGSVERVFPTRAETIDYLRDLYERDLPIEEAERAEAFYVALGLFTPDVDLREVYLTLLNSQVAGFYDPETKRMNVIPMLGDTPGDALSLTEQITYVHEFVHALQDQHFDLNALLSADLSDQPDRLLAAQALVEGDATAVMTVFLQNVAAENPLAALSILTEGAAAGSLFLPPGIPAILVTELMFPYEEGASFVTALYADGGWDAVNAAYAALPQTTEQIIHPEKYLSGETALPVALDDGTALLGAGWTQTWDMTLGEFYLRAQIDAELTSSRARRAAAGWGGDRFHVYVNGDQVASALRVAWDTPEDAAEFADIYAAYADERFGGAAVDGCWSNATTALCLAANADGSSLVVTAPTVELALRLR